MNSIVSYPERGQGGKNSYRGNCSPRLIKDIIEQFKMTSLSDYMVGSGTTEDVCLKEGVQGMYLDLNRGFDMLRHEIPENAKNIFWHPPYDDIVVYSDNMYSADTIISQYGFDPRQSDLSRCNGWKDFVDKMNFCTMKQYTSLEKGGRMFILMGDIKKKRKLYSMLLDIIKPGTIENIVIKAQHNCVSDSRSYAGKFIPIVHEYMLILRKDAALLLPVKMTRDIESDVRDMRNTTWRDVLVSVFSDNGPLTLDQIYSQIDGHKKCEQNTHWKEKVRQTLQKYPCFASVERGLWKKTA